MAGPYVITRDSRRRLHADLSDEVGVSFRLLAEDHPRRIASNVHAYVIMSIVFEIGGKACTFVIRDIKVVKNPTSEHFDIYYRQWEPIPGGPEKRWLDEAGPQDRTSRATMAEAILAVFFQIKEEAAAGTLCQPKVKQPKNPVINCMTARCNWSHLRAKPPPVLSNVICPSVITAPPP